MTLQQCLFVDRGQSTYANSFAQYALYNKVTMLKIHTFFSYVLGNIQVKFHRFASFYKEVEGIISIISEQPSYMYIINLNSEENVCFALFLKDVKLDLFGTMFLF